MSFDFFRSFRPFRVINRQSLFFLACCAVFGTAFWNSPDPAPSPFLTKSVAASEPGASATASNTEPEFEAYFASDSIDDHVHSASIAGLSNGDLMAVWFAGSREGARDVNIRAARFDARRQAWGEEFVLISRDTTEAVLQRDIRKLGNPVIAEAPNGRLWLFYVSVSVGGWAGSAINAMYSDDLGENWSQPRRLITSPFLNISNLVRNPPVFHADGSFGLPIYHEFLGKFPEYLYLNADGGILDKYRISKGRNSLQPAVVPVDENRALALLRNADEGSGRVLASFTQDRGKNWTAPVPMAPWNPNSAVAAVGEGDENGDVLVALNDLRDGRFRLSLYHADQNLKDWRLVDVLDQAPVLKEQVEADLFRGTVARRYMAVAMRSGEGMTERMDEMLEQSMSRACGYGMCEFKYEYPSLIRTSDGYFHLVYSWHNTLIKHVRFNQAWLEAQR
jgi:predicted neuraminidase